MSVEKAQTQSALALIHARTSVAHFDPNFVLDDASIAALVGHAGQALSAYNQQNWRFIAVNFDAAEVSAEFDSGAQELPVMLVAIGRPAAGNWLRKERLPVDEMLAIV